jgi:hypothetical protein
VKAALAAVAAAALFLSGMALGLGTRGDGGLPPPDVVRLQREVQPTIEVTPSPPPAPDQPWNWVEREVVYVEDGEVEVEQEDEGGDNGGDNSGPGSDDSGPGSDDSGPGSDDSGDGGDGSGSSGSGSSGSGSSGSGGSGSGDSGSG